MPSQTSVAAPSDAEGYPKSRIRRDLSQGPFVDTYRTILVAPPPEVRDVLMAIQDFGLVA